MEKAESLEGRMGNYDIGNAFLEKIKTISNSFEDPEGIELSMRHMMMQTKAKIHALYVKDLLQTLLERGMGTPEVFNLTKRLYNRRKGDTTKKQETITKIVMKDKLKDAWNKVRKERVEEQREWRKLRRKLRNRQSADDRTGYDERTARGTNATNEVDTSRNDIDVIAAISETNTQYRRSRVRRGTETINGEGEADRWVAGTEVEGGTRDTHTHATGKVKQIDG